MPTTISTERPSEIVAPLVENQPSKWKIRLPWQTSDDQERIDKARAKLEKKENKIIQPK